MDVLSKQKRIGPMRERIQIQKAGYSQNAANEKIAIWGVFAEVWARKEAVTGTEVFKSEQITAYSKVKFIIRYCPGLNEAMIVVWEGITFNIEQLNETEAQRFIEIIAKKQQ